MMGGGGAYRKAGQLLPATCAPNTSVVLPGALLAAVPRFLLLYFFSLLLLSCLRRC